MFARERSTGGHFKHPLSASHSLEQILKGLDTLHLFCIYQAEIQHWLKCKSQQEIPHLINIAAQMQKVQKH